MDEVDNAQIIVSEMYTHVIYHKIIFTCKFVQIHKYYVLMFTLNFNTKLDNITL